MELLSVVIPVYNSEKYIERCLESVISQTYENLEIVIVDDGSEDSTIELCKKFKENDNRIKIISQPHMGVCKARKNGIKEATGKYITFVDSDDWIEEDCFEKRMCGGINDADVVLSGYYTEREREHPLFLPLIPEGLYSGENLKEIWKYIFFTGEEKYIYTILWCNMYKTEKLKGIIDEIPDGLVLYEDYCINFIMLLKQANQVQVINEAGYHNCLNENSATAADYRNDYLKTLDLYYQFLTKIMEGHPYQEILKPKLNTYLKRVCKYDLPGVLKIGVDPSCIYYPYYGRLENKKVVLYGAGEIGQAYYHHIVQDGESILIAWVDKQYQKYGNENFGMDIISPDILSELEFDFIICAVWERKTAMEIKKELVNRKVPEEKILWNKTHRI